jgi:hypothetical protein
LKKAVSESTLDKLMLKEALEERTRIREMLVAEGWWVNIKRLYRIWEGAELSAARSRGHLATSIRGQPCWG